MPDSPYSAEHKARQMERQERIYNKVKDDETVQRIVSMTRDGWRDIAIRRELKLTDEEFTKKRKLAVKAGMLCK